MGTHYQQLTIEERCEISRLQAAGHSIRQVAASLDRAPSTIARELKRNGSQTQGYRPSYAHQQARARRWRGARLERDGELRQQVLSRLKAGWSPEQVAGRLALEAGRRVISYESIYRFIYSQLARKKDHSWRHYLPRAKSKRGWRGRKGGSSATFIQLRRPLSQRPPDADGRHTPGHWEADLMQFGNRGPVVLTLQERSSRLCFIRKLPGKAAEPVADALEQLLAPFPTSWRKSITFDNGAEFARHYRLHHLGFETFFCDTRSPWQKGGVENANGRLRRYLPRRTVLDTVSDEALTQLNQACNNTPRKCLGYRTPAEIFAIRVLHLKCEFTLNQERERHIREKHSELLPDFYRYIATTLAQPEHIQRSQTHDNTRLFTRWDETRAKYVIVVVVSDADPRDWIVTAYIADKPAKGATEWMRN